MILYIKQVMKVLAWHKDYNVVLEGEDGMSQQIERSLISDAFTLEEAPVSSCTVLCRVAVPPAPASASWKIVLPYNELPLPLQSSNVKRTSSSSWMECWSSRGMWLRTSSQQWRTQATGGGPPASSGRPPASDGGPPTTGGRPPATGGGPPATGGGPPASGRGPPATGGGRGIGGGGGASGGGGGGPP
uniref:Uncharacterized protein n=1 Tax=Amphimedon queenslandica TaxID=400682 RepID=A0A1X7TN00_AMPQE